MSCKLRFGYEDLLEKTILFQDVLFNWVVVLESTPGLRLETNFW